MSDFDKTRSKCNMNGCYIVDSVGHKGGLAIMWSKDCEDV